MSLANAVLKIADKMEAEFAGGPADVVVRISGYANMLRIAVEAAEGETPAQEPFRYPCGHVHSSAEAAAKCRAGVRAVEQKVQSEESGGSRMMLLVGGKNDTVMVPLDASAPVGAKTIVEGEVYVKKDDGKLHFSQEETEKMRSKNG